MGGADILQPRSDVQPFLKDSLWWARPPGQPNTLLSAIDPKEHARIRQVLAPAFTARALRIQEPSVLRYVNLLVERLNETLTKATEDGEAQGSAEIDISL